MIEPVNPEKEILGAVWKPTGTAPLMKTGMPRHHRESMETALNYIEHHMASAITLDQLARTCGISKFHFTRIFKQYTGLSFKKYLNAKRVDIAKYVLTRDGATVTEACYEAGFNDLSYFNRIFRRLEGATPTQYRERLMAEAPARS